ncbi:MAG: ferredoxin reductase [Austwickia sp.]|nr:ferredoxin reductase [Actinomycetota bacterium]MCB1254643.1 ferredoxin reductase [Austwickia sp.]MCO5310264.1 ferredoxin reductase [Austwickia sp.]
MTQFPHARQHRGLRIRDAALKVASWATTPLLPTDYLDLIDPLRLGSQLRGRIVARTMEGPDAATLLIRPGRGWTGHEPGQFVRIGVDVDGVRHWRSYSLTHAVDAADGLISITVKRGGHVSGHLVDVIAPGALVQLEQAAGDFVMTRPAPAKVLFLTAGSGITPILAMLRNDRTAGADVAHLHCGPDAASLLFAAELADRAAAGQITLTPWHTRERGRLDLSTTTTLDALVPDWRERQAWVCGPGEMLDAAHELWGAAGLADALHVERYQPVLAAVGEGGVVSFARTGVAVQADGSTPLLDAGEEMGVLMPSGCRMGICFGCCSSLTSGSVRDLRTGDLTSAPPDGEIVVQTCINAAAGPCTVDL